ncbi:hypothetical protein [Oleidesulfovibrio alaskensis]
MQPKLSIHSRGTAKGFLRSVLRGVLTDDSGHLARAMAEQEHAAGVLSEGAAPSGAAAGSSAGDARGAADR